MALLLQGILWRTWNLEVLWGLASKEIQWAWPITRAASKDLSQAVLLHKCQMRPSEAGQGIHSGLIMPALQLKFAGSLAKLLNAASLPKA